MLCVRSTEKNSHAIVYYRSDAADRGESTPGSVAALPRHPGHRLVGNCHLQSLPIQEEVSSNSVPMPVAIHVRSVGLASYPTEQFHTCFFEHQPLLFVVFQRIRHIFNVLAQLGPHRFARFLCEVTAMHGLEGLFERESRKDTEHDQSRIRRQTP